MSQNPLQLRPCLGTRTSCAPGYDAVWAYEDSPDLSDAVGFEKRAIDISETLFWADGAD
jgi:hypothetical protein